MNDSQNEMRVVISRVDMTFGHMVVLILKWTLAAIPAMIIVWGIFAMLALIFGGLFAGIGAAMQGMQR